MPIRPSRPRGDGTVTVNVGFLFDLILGSPVPRNRRQERAPNRDVVILNQAAPAIPLPTPSPTPQLPGTPPPPIEQFPRGPAANDPVFRRPGFGIGRIFGIGGVLIDVATILVGVIERRQLERMGDIIREQDKTIADRTRERALERAEREAELAVEKAASSLENAPDTFDPTPTQPQVEPETRTFPFGNPFGIPAIIPTAVPAVVESPAPVVAPLPDILPAPVEIPVPSVPPVVVPAPLPVPDPGILVVPRINPLTGVDAASLVSSQVGGIPLGQQAGFVDVSVQDFPTPQTAPQTDPARCRPRKCDDDLDDPRTECFKGLYVESSFDTDFIQWAEVDCLTGVQIES